MRAVWEAWELLDTEIAALPAEGVALLAAQGRVLRRDVITDLDQPPFARSAMDGYLVNAGESASELRVRGEVAPGDAPRMPELGTAIRVFTGSAVPEEGAAVVMQEEVEREGEFVRLRASPDSAHIRARGSQARRGDVLVAAGTTLSPGAMALLAACGADHPLVSPRIRVAHVATGRELAKPGSGPAPGQIRDSNSTMVLALVREAGAEMVWQGGVDERPSALASAIGSAVREEPHMLLVSGGASVGDHDHTADVFRDAGFEILLRGVAVRPGKPLIFARRERLSAFCLPGNPLSHFVAFHLFVRRAIYRLSGTAPLAATEFPVKDVSAIDRNPRETWWPCRMVQGSEGLEAMPLPWADSSDITPLARTEGLMRVPPGGLGPRDMALVLMTGPLAV